MHKNDKQWYIKIAKQLCYSEKVIGLLREATTNVEREKIMANARKGVIR